MPKEQFIRRIQILKGQLDGIAKMMEANESCEKTLPQVKAVKNAFLSLSSEITKEYLRECLPKSSTEKVETLIDMLSKF